ncbi:MAG TPA: hypothetical protein VG713_07225 [Pirellulales bacterium]|nr:hypothetical protein [Pirellulales bacterium]
MLFSTVVVAQYYRPYHRYGGYGYGGYGGGYGGGTVYGSYAAGMGNLVRSQGIYNQLTAQAAIDAEQAKSAALDNQLKATQTYFEMRKINQESRAAEQARTASIARGDRKYESAISQPTTLTVSQLDPVSGHIQWPSALMSSAAANDRAELETIFAQRAQNSPAFDTSRIHVLTDSMRDSLKQQVLNVRPQEFTDSMRFLRGLDDAAHQTTLAAATHNNTAGG